MLPDPTPSVDRFAMPAADAPIPPAVRAAGLAAAQKCVHFGFCTAVCPTYVLDGEENDSPRGRIDLMREMLSRGGPPDPVTVVHVDRCLSCLSCTSTCAAGVDYRTLVDTARRYIEASGVRPPGERLWRKGLAAVLTTPALFRAALLLGRPAARLVDRLPAGLRGRLPARLRALTELAKAPGLASLQRDAAAGAAPAGACSADARQPVRDPPPVRAVALLDGCAQSVVGGAINAAARRLLARRGIAVLDEPEGGCCGAMKLHLGDHAGAVRQMAPRIDRWAEALAAGRIEAVVSTTSGCGSVLVHAADVFDDDPARRARAERVAAAHRDIAALLATVRPAATDRPNQVRPDGARRDGARPAGAWPDEPPSPGSRPGPRPNEGAVVGYHDACSLRHGQRCTAEPRMLLADAGFRVAEPGEAHLCCGSAGTYNLLQPAIADRLGARKAANLDATRPDLIVAGNLGCLLQISRFSPRPVAHLVQALDWAEGGPAPAGLEAFEPVPPAAVADAANGAAIDAEHGAAAPSPGAPDDFW